MPDIERANAAERRLQEVLDAAGMGTFVWHVADDRGEPDRRMLQLFGFSQMPADPSAALRDRIHPDDRERYATAIRGALDPTGSGTLRDEIRVRHADGSVHWLAIFGYAEFAGSPIRAAQMLGLARDITARKHDEAELRENHERQSYLLGLIDALRPLSSAREIQAAATRVLGQRLGASRVLYAEIEKDGDDLHYLIRQDFHAPDLVSAAGRHRANDMGSTLLGDLRAGLTLAVTDVSAEIRLAPEERERRIRGGVQAYVAVPLMKAGDLVAFIAAFARSPRQWTGAEIALVEETAERTWAAVERGRAEEARLRSEETLAAELRDTQVLQRISGELIQQDDIHALYEKILDAAIVIVGSEFAALHMFHAQGGGDGELRLLASRGFGADADELWRRIRADDAETACGVALRTRARVVVANVEHCDFMRQTKHLEAYRRDGIHALQSTPLVSRSGKLVGMLSTHWRALHPLSESTLNLLDILARQAADLIDRSCNERALRENEERFRMIADNMSQLAWTCDQLGDVNWYNRRWYEYTGLAREESLGHGWMQVQHPDHAARVVAGIKRARELGETWEDTFPMRRVDGTYRWFLSRAVPIRDDSGHITRWFGTNTDVTRQRGAELALQEADRRKNEFLAMLAHELRNPLAPIRNALEILKRNATDRAVVESTSSLLERQVAHMVRLVDDLLDVNRITRGSIKVSKERLEVGPIVEQAAAAIRPMTEHRQQELAVNLPSTPIYVDADATRLAQIVGNLLNNASKFTERGGSIRVEVEPRGNEALVRVRDSGIGIEQDKLSRVFELFTQLDTSLERPQAGLGIGLTLVKRLVELHDGSVEVHSDGLGKGSEFVVRLPKVSAPPGARQDAPVAAPETAVRRKVLVVDDNRDAALSFEQYLKLSGQEVAVAFDGCEAVQTAASFEPDVILLDLGLPKLSGYAAARQIREQLGDRPIIVAVTGWGQEDDLRESAASGFDAHLVKPVNPSALMVLLDELAQRNVPSGYPRAPEPGVVRHG